MTFVIPSVFSHQISVPNRRRNLFKKIFPGAERISVLSIWSDESFRSRVWSNGGAVLWRRLGKLNKDSLKEAMIANTKWPFRCSGVGHNQCDQYCHTDNFFMLLGNFKEALLG